MILLMDCDNILLRHLGFLYSNNVSCAVQLASSGIASVVVTFFGLGGF
jgi:hypothetical protein